MDTDAVREISVSLDDVNSLQGISSNGDIEVFGRAGEVLTKVELDSACSSEKLLNLSILMMHVATREHDFEAFAFEKEHMLVDYVEEAMEFDLLSGILDSEVRELEKFMDALQKEIANAREIISSCEYLGETLMVLEEKLCDSEESLKQSQDQVSEIMMQSAKFQRTLSCFNGEDSWNIVRDEYYTGDERFFNTNTKIKMQTAEQQRHILRMLEKSLAREMDLEKKWTESRLIEEELKQRLHSSEQELFCMEDEATESWERLFEAENVAEVLTGISKELLRRLHIIQFNLNGSVQREAELKSKLDARVTDLRRLESSNTKLDEFLVAQISSLKASLAEAEDKSILAHSEAFTLRDKVSLLEKQLKESEFHLPDKKVNVDDTSQEQHSAMYSDISETENVVEELKNKLSEAESMAENVEGRCKLLEETNMELNEELGLLKESCNAEKVESYERQLRESEMQLHHAVASAEASLEKQNMLYATIGDMENVIEDLKLKVSKAETRADSAEQKCIILSETSAELNEELVFLRGKIECLEESLHRSEETKVATAKDINMRTRVITDLVMQLAIERERLHQQISSLAKENKILVVQLHQTGKDCSVDTSDISMQNSKDFGEIKGEVTDLSVNLSQVRKNVSVGGKESEPVDSTSEVETVRSIDAGLHNFKYVFLALNILLISFAVYIYHQQGGRV